MSPPPPAEDTLRRRSHPFLFPKAQSTVLPDPSRFFSPHLLSAPLPTNSFFPKLCAQKNGDQPEYIHPYLIKSSLSSLSLCYPSQFSNSAFTYQIFNPDLTISASNNTDPNSTHVVSSFNDLSLTLDFPSSNLKFFLGGEICSCLPHPLHLRLLSGDDCEITVLEDLKYKSIDGELVGVVGDSWVLKSDPVSVTWHSIRGELVAWTLPALAREGVGEGWKGFLYALEGIYDKEGALSKIRSLNGYDDGNSLTNLLWWIHSRGDAEEGVRGEGSYAGLVTTVTRMMNCVLLSSLCIEIGLE
ncbi:glycosyl hydrolase family 81 protein [Actinidia rufa]|uniref:Glycosyl hydrolase family 81 protein n=1 Tax=Actinidia rufa TaxID=165716 RepID=A0A7J0ELK6_9ERIC|nr:glycosyl hydrolase family 81 protein [Actinidia rufa]